MEEHLTLLKAFTELYNGTNWTELGDLNSAVSGNTGTGTTSLALSFGGDPDTDGTEEWNAAPILTKVLTD